MKQKYHIMLRVVSVIVASCVFGGCVHYPEAVRVSDEVSGMPIRSAKVTIIYPSFNGDTSVTDIDGFARTNGFRGSPGAACYVRIEASGYEGQEIDMYDRKLRRLEVALKPLNTPNQALVPTPMSVTAPAEQEPRRP